MIKKLFLSIFLLSSVTVFAQTDSLANALLWKISGKNIKKASYLYGTIHAIPQSDFFFTPVMERAFNACEELVMEMDLNFSAEQQMQMMLAMMLPEGKSLKDYMDKETYKKFMNYLKEDLKISQVNLFLIPKIKPLFSFTLILQDKIENQVSFEEYFKKLAQKNNMIVSGLESLQEQMNILNGIPIEEQVELLTDTAEYTSNIMSDYYKMVNDYKNQNLNKLIQTTGDEKLIQKYSSNLLDNRNRKWLKLIAQKIETHPCFIAVGAGHLAGQSGLIILLRSMGYTVVPVDVFEKQKNGN
ncbi:MAG: TraB/GumN family protein [Bacteroidales bacterium]|nr:TraB/GumN family protein [Bacteroidales bacterium]